MTVNAQDRAIEAEVEALEVKATKLIIRTPSSQQHRRFVETIALVALKVIAKKHGFDPRTGQYLAAAPIYPGSAT